MEESMILREAAVYLRDHGRPVSTSYLTRIAQTQLRGELRDEGPVPYWVVPQAALDEYLRTSKPRGRRTGNKPKTEGEA
jgi:hypothetical protein